MEEQHIDEELTAPHDLGLQLKVFAGSLASAGLIDLLAHKGWIGLAFGAAASVALAKNSPVLYEQISESLPWHALSQATTWGGRSLVDRALGRFPEQQAIAAPRISGSGESEAQMIERMTREHLAQAEAWLKEAEEERLATDRQQRPAVSALPVTPAPRVVPMDPLPRRHETPAVVPALPARVSDEEDMEDDGHVPWKFESDEGDDEEDDGLVPPTGMWTFSQVLESGFVPQVDHLFLGRTTEGHMVFCQVQDLCHVALAGSTGGGKSSIMRLLMAQLCRVRASVLLLNPHYTDYDVETDEDWTPFRPYLIADPLECRKIESIEHYLKYVATVLLPKRAERYAKSQPMGKPYFLVLDELPSIMSKIPDAPKYLSEILREGRKFKIYIIAASQDFLVKTIDPSGGGGAVRACYRTAFYTGGDGTTAKVLLDLAGKQIDENQLGRGTVMVRNAAVLKRAMVSRVPYTDNESLYRLLGPSTYQRSAVPATPAFGEDLVPPVSWSAAAAASESQPVHREQAPPPTVTTQPVITAAIDVHVLKTLKETLPPELFAEAVYRLVAPQQVETTAVVVPATPAMSEEEDLLERGIAAYKDGATSIDKLQAALGLETQHKARQLRAKILAVLAAEEQDA